MIKKLVFPGGYLYIFLSSRAGYLQESGVLSINRAEINKNHVYTPLHIVYIVWKGGRDDI